MMACLCAGKIPDEKVAMQLTPQTVARMAPGQPAWPANVVSQVWCSGFTLLLLFVWVRSWIVIFSSMIYVCFKDNK